MLLKLDFWVFILYWAPPLQNFLQQERLVGSPTSHSQPFLSCLPPSHGKLTTLPAPLKAKCGCHREARTSDRWTQICWRVLWGSVCFSDTKNRHCSCHLSLFLPDMNLIKMPRKQGSHLEKGQKNNWHAYFQEDFLLRKKIYPCLFKTLVGRFSVTCSWSHS